MTLRSSKYLSYIRSKPCVVTGSDVDVVAHHVRLGFFGAGMKPSDFRCLPLTAEEHGHLHHVGEKRYWEMRGEDPFQLIVMQMLVYLAQTTEDHQGIIPDLEQLCASETVPR